MPLYRTEKHFFRILHGNLIIFWKIIILFYHLSVLRFVFYSISLAMAAVIFRVWIDNTSIKHSIAYDFCDCYLDDSSLFFASLCDNAPFWLFCSLFIFAIYVSYIFSYALIYFNCHVHNVMDLSEEFEHVSFFCYKYAHYNSSRSGIKDFSNFKVCCFS